MTEKVSMHRVMVVLLVAASVALGAYVATPLEIAGAYTVFANGGIRVKPTAISSAGEQHQALDSRVAWLMVDLLQEVMRSGTAAGVRARGFTLPAAGKTGTSRDGWFAGYTSNVLCVVWVGFDDYRELGLSGAAAAEQDESFAAPDFKVQVLKNFAIVDRPKGDIAKLDGHAVKVGIVHRDQN